jgi:hypothetical protein
MLHLKHLTIAAVFENYVLVEGNLFVRLGLHRPQLLDLLLHQLILPLEDLVLDQEGLSLHARQVAVGLHRMLLLGSY